MHQQYSPVRSPHSHQEASGGRFWLTIFSCTICIAHPFSPYHSDKGTNYQRQNINIHLYLPSRGQVHLHREPNMKLLPARKACGKVENLHATDLQRSSGDTLKGQGPQWRNRSALGDEIWKWPEPHRHGLRRQGWRLLWKN